MALGAFLIRRGEQKQQNGGLAGVGEIWQSPSRAITGQSAPSGRGPSICPAALLLIKSSLSKVETFGGCLLASQARVWPGLGHAAVVERHLLWVAEARVVYV